MLPRPLLNFSVVPVTSGSCLFPWLLIVAGWPLGEPSGLATHRKFSDAARRLAEEIGQGGKTGAEQLAGHCFRQALKGSARHAELFLAYTEGKPKQGVELSKRQ